MQNFITNMKKTIFASLLLIIATILAGCDKKMEPNTQNILGLWVENDVINDTTLQSDSRVTYYFGNDNMVTISVSHASGGDTTIVKSWCFNLYGDDILSLNAEMSDFSGENWRVTKLTENEMHWESYFPNNSGWNCYVTKHLIRVKK